jgi:hypothetical protein
MLFGQERRVNRGAHSNARQAATDDIEVVCNNLEMVRGIFDKAADLMPFERDQRSPFPRRRSVGLPYAPNAASIS